MSEIVVTGISRGLGHTVAVHLLDKGYSVVGISRTCNEEITAWLERYPNQFRFIPFDFMQSDRIKNDLFDDNLSLKNPIAAFVNNAAIAYDDLITNINLDSLHKMFAVNVYSPMLMVKYIIRNMLFHKIAGSIVHLSSISAHTGYKGLAMYASTKGALEAFSKNTAREWGERKIRSNCIVAGFMETDMNRSLSDEQKQRIYKRTSLKKAVDPLVVARAVEFLVSEQSSSITGQNIFVDSGTI
ncbi:MAG TPA: SDR family oxidoreductase [bacterium]|nr:SDR family oxidoreductase [bacterium]